jgi:hypothetical protein
MGINLSTINLDGVDPNVAFDPLPAGWYNAVIINAEMRPNGPNAKDPNGQQMEITLQVIDGEHAGRKLFDRLNLINSNPAASEIAYKTLKAIYNAIGVARVNDSAEMHGIPLKVKVKLKPAEGTYSANNEVQGYDHISSDHSTGAGVGGTLARGVPGAVQGTPAWAGAAPGAAAPVTPSFAAPGPAAAPSAAPAFAGAPQPWAQPPAAAAPADPMAGARADGWQAHPQHPGYSWRGQDVVSDQELAAHYQPAAPAPVAAPTFTPPAGPPAFGGAPAAGTAAPGAPWAAGPGPAAAAPTPQFGAPAPATATGGPTPPWAR